MTGNAEPNSPANKPRPIVALACVLLPSLSLLSGCVTPPPNPPLPRSWSGPRSAAEVLHDGLRLPPEETQELIAEINAKLRRAYDAGDDLSYQSMSYEEGKLKVGITGGLTAVYGVELRKVFGRWRPGRTSVFYCGGPGFSK